MRPATQARERPRSGSTKLVTRACTRRRKKGDAEDGMVGLRWSRAVHRLAMAQAVREGIPVFRLIETAVQQYLLQARMP